MQISSLKMEAWVSLTQSLSIISLFPSLALKHLLQHRLRPTGSLRLCLRVASNVTNVAKFSSSMSVPRQFISVNLISLSYFDINWQTFCFFLFYDSCHWFLQFGFQKCVERCIIGALYSLLPPVERLLFLNVSMGAAVMSQAELDRTEEIKL